MIGLPSPWESIFCWTDVSLLCGCPCKITAFIHNTAATAYPGNVTLSRGGKLVVRISLNTDPCSHSHMPPCRECTGTWLYGAACVKGLLEIHFLWVSKKELMPSSHTFTSLYSCRSKKKALLEKVYWCELTFLKKQFEQVQQANNGP